MLPRERLLFTRNIRIKLKVQRNRLISIKYLLSLNPAINSAASAGGSDPYDGEWDPSEALWGELRKDEEELPGVDGREEVDALLTEGGYHDCCVRTSWEPDCDCWSWEPLNQNS